MATGPTISFFFAANAASSKGFVISSRPKKGNSPPCAAEPGSCDSFLATSAKELGLLRTRAAISCALASAAFFSASFASGFTVMRMWLALRISFVPCLPAFTSSS